MWENEYLFTVEQWFKTNNNSFNRIWYLIEWSARTSVKTWSGVILDAKTELLFVENDEMMLNSRKKE